MHAIMDLLRKKYSQFLGGASFSDKSKHKIITVFLIAYLAVSFFLYQAASLGTPVCFADCLGYIELMNKSGFEYIATLRHMFRPWTVPFFFSIFGTYSMGSAAKIILTQTYIAYLAWMFFAYACQTFLTTRTIKIIGFVLISSLMFGQGYYHFNQYLLSDSLALSLVLIQLSLCLLFQRVVRTCQVMSSGPLYIKFYMFLVVIVSAAEIAARDSNILLALGGTVLSLFTVRPLLTDKKREAILILSALLLGLIQSPYAQSRHRVNAENIAVATMLPDENIRAYLVAHGIPADFAAMGNNMKLQNLDNANLDEVIASRKLFDSKGGVPMFVKLIIFMCDFL